MLGRRGACDKGKWFWCAVRKGFGVRAASFPNVFQFAHLLSGGLVLPDVKLLLAQGGVQAERDYREH